MNKTSLQAADVSRVLTQVVLVAVAGLVGVGEPGVKGSSPVGLDLLLDIVSHFFDEF